MKESFNKYEKINQLIKKLHSESLYSSKPLPKLIAVSKQQPNEKILDSLKLGQRIYGENKLQDALKRWTNLVDMYKDIELHCIDVYKATRLKKL